MPKEFAPGIKDKKHYPELPTIKEPTKWEYTLHHHEAEVRGTHKDLRLGNPETGHAHSWALNKIPKPGEASFVIEQPVHTVKYMDFKGTIEEGYGKGKVDIDERNKVEVVNSKPGHISFNIYRGYGPEEYTLHRMGGKIWKMYNRTPTKESHNIPLYKPKYKEVDLDKVLEHGEDFLMSAKIDDAHQIFHFGDKIRSFSYRESKRNPNGIIEHTHKLNLPDAPKELKDTIVRGGIYAIDNRTGRAMQNAELGGLLNSNVWKSREDQEKKGKLKTVIYDVQKYKGKDVSSEPYEKKLEILKEINQKLPQFELPSMATTAKEKEKLLNEISSGAHKETSEGVVLWPLKEGKPPIKAKVFKDHDVYVRDFFEGQGKYKHLGVGGFTYSHSPDGPIAGKVGTGLSDALRKDMYIFPDKYKGLVAIVGAQEKYNKGALRVPAFYGWHLDKQELPEDIIKK